MSKEIDPRRGSVTWSFNRFRSDILAKFLDDLMARERVGLNSEECEIVKLYIGSIVNAATAIPDGGFLRRAVWTELQVFENLYVQWNEITGQNEQALVRRKKLLGKMRRRRHRIARRIRNNMHVITEELDLKLVDALYEASAELIKTLPDIFNNLSRALKSVLSALPN